MNLIRKPNNLSLKLINIYLLIINLLKNIIHSIFKFLFIIFVEVKPKFKFLLMKKITLIIVTVLFAFSNINAQISSSDCKKTCEIERIVQKDALIGIRIQNLKCGEPGVKVIEVLENTSAKKFDLRVNDIIYFIDNEEILSTKHLVEIVASHNPSELVVLTTTRNGVEEDKEIILGAKTTNVVKETICCDNKDPFFNELNVSLYPNPSISNVNVSMESAETGKYTFQIFNTIGEQVFVEIDSYDAGFSKSIALENLSGGEYFMKITKGKNTITKAFAVVK